MNRDTTVLNKPKMTAPLLITIMIVVVLLIFFGIVFSCGLVGFFIYNAVKIDQVEGNSAMEGWVLAEPVARNWDPDGYLYSVTGEGEDHNNNGTAPRWIFHYYSEKKSTNIWVIANTKSAVNDGSHHENPNSRIVNWTQDSTDAVMIARGHPEYSDFLNTHSSARIYSLSLNSDSVHSYWHVQFSGGTISYPSWWIATINCTSATVEYTS